MKQILLFFKYAIWGFIFLMLVFMILTFSFLEKAKIWLVVEAFMIVFILVPIFLFIGMRDGLKKLLHFFRSHQKIILLT